MLYAIGRNVFEQRIDRAPLPAAEGVRRIAIAAPQRTTGQPNENTRPPDVQRFTLNGAKNLRDAQPLRLRCRCDDQPVS
jgi:hypothetical protein